MPLAQLRMQRAELVVSCLTNYFKIIKRGKMTAHCQQRSAPAAGLKEGGSCPQLPPPFYNQYVANNCNSLPLPTYQQQFKMAATTDNKAYEEALDDVHTRFILNLPDEELQSAPRIFFQLEQAWWFYDDFICDGAAAAAASAAAEENGSGNNKKQQQQEQLPRFKHVKPFGKFAINIVCNIAYCCVYLFNISCKDR